MPSSKLYKSPVVDSDTGALTALVSLIANSAVYGSALQGFLWVVRSSDIATWEMEWWKSSVLMAGVLVLRTYNRIAFRKKP